MSAEDDLPTQMHLSELLGGSPGDDPAQPAGTLSIRPAGSDLRELRDTLPTLALAGSGAAKPYLEMLGELGQGGAGIVHLARQIPLGRRVAVKSLKRDSEQASDELLREARITGLLEHPNIVPVYTLGQDARGLPLLVMKRVEGRSWRALLQADRGEHQLLSETVLRRHVEILMQVCNAVSFAHSKGIIHRDLKPENVMIGGFGEIYVLDWGIAIAVSTEGHEQLGWTREVDGLAGTPAYMAPEMVDGDLMALGTHTDIYLLGAVLHELICGQRRHRGTGLAAVLASASTSTPYTYGPEQPSELVEICQHAMRRDPAERFPDAATLRDALAGYLQHHSSVELAAEAHLRLKALAVALSEEQARVEQLFAECRFAFQLALKAWPENPEALRGLERALRLMVDFELGRGAYERATHLLEALREPDAELQHRLEALRLRLERDQQSLSRLRQHDFETDLDVSARLRGLVALAMACIFSVVPFMAGALAYAGWLELPGWQILVFPAGGLLVFGGGSWRLRHLFLKNRANRAVVGSVMFAFVSIFLHRLIALRHGAPPHLALGQDIGIMFAIVGTLAICLDRRLGWAAACFLLTGLGVAAWPAGALMVLGVGVGLGLGAVWWVWR